MINSFLLPVLSLIAFFSCKVEKPVKVITYYMEIPLVPKEKEDIQYFIDSIDIINLDGDMIYRFPYTNQHILVDYFNNGEDTWDSVRLIPKYRFLYAKLGQQKGYYTDSGYKVFQQPLDADSILLSQGVFQDSLFLPTRHVLNDSIYNEDEGALFKQYLLVSKPGPDYPDTIKYWFSRNLEDFPFTISPTMEKWNGMKLAKVQFWFAPFEYEGRPYKERSLVLGVIRNDRKYSRQQVEQMLKELKPAGKAD